MKQKKIVDIKTSLTKKIAKKTLLIESSEFLSKITLSKELKEAVKMSAGKAGTLIVRNIPTTILNRLNQNGRIYTTEVVQQAINEAKDALQTKQLLSQACEHPEGSFVAPTVASHVVTGAYIKKNVKLVVEGKEGVFDVLFQDWEVLNTQEGKNLRALFEAECSIGTSIRGVGDMNGKYVEGYSLLGCDCVGNPSSSTFTRMPISESIKVELLDPRELKETFTVSTSSTNVVRNLEAAAAIQQQLDGIGYGTVTKTSTKVDEETDPKTGTQTSITTLEAETSDDVSDLDQALMMAKNAMLNGTVNIDSITIENIKEEQPKESIEEYSPLTEAVEEETKENRLNGKKFVIKTPSGYVGVEGNGLIFLDDPHKALHFVHGKEEGGMVPYSNIEKKLDSIGMFDVERHYQNTKTDIGVQTPIEEPAKENKTLDEDNGNNTKYLARVEMAGPGNAPEITNVPISATDLDAALSEVSNLWEMKTKANGGTNANVKLIDTQTNEEFLYNPTSNTLDPLESNSSIQPTVPEENTIPTQEAFGKDPITQDDNKVSVELDKDTTIEKEFETPVQAQVAKAGIEQGKVDPNVLMSEESIEPGWYIRFFDGGWKKDIEWGDIYEGPFNSEEEADARLNDIVYEYARTSGDFDLNMSPKDVMRVTSIGIEEKIYSNPSAASDPYIQKPLQDAEEEKVIVSLSEIDWDEDSIVDNFDNLSQPDNVASGEDLISLLDNLPDEYTVEIPEASIAGITDVVELKTAIISAINTESPLKIKNATIIDIK